MKRTHILLYILAICLVAACKKDEVKPSLPPRSISIQGLAAKDTMLKNMPVLKDTPVIINLNAVLEGQVSMVDHIVTFRVDTTRLSEYRLKYGNATLLPYNAYLLFRSRCRIPAGASVSDSVQLNLTAQTTLKPETLYVLPIVIQNVDGSTDPVAAQQVLYIVIKTGKALDIDKSTWRIVSVSSTLAGSPATNLLDKDINTEWGSDFFGVPANIVFDFSQPINFSGVTYRVNDSYYVTGGGYPVKVKIEVSMDLSTWIDKGTYNGITTPGTWSQSIGATTARYMRFTVLEAAPLFGFSIAILGDVSLIP